MRTLSSRLGVISSVACLTLTLVSTTPGSAAAPTPTANAKKIAASVKTTTAAILTGSKVTSRFQIGTFTGSTKLTITDATRYTVDVDRREAISDGSISYERLAAELDEEDLATVHTMYPTAVWYSVSAYDQALAETIGFTFEDLTFGIRHARGLTAKRVGTATEYRFTVPGTKAPTGGEQWYGVTKKTSVRFTVVLDTKQRITAMTITGPSKTAPESMSVKITYGSYPFTTPDPSTVITWEQLVAVVPSLLPPVPSGWTRVDDLSASCTDAVKPLRALMDRYPSGLLIEGPAIKELNTAIAVAVDGCPDADYARFYDLEFYGWLVGYEREPGAPAEDTPTEPAGWREGFTAI